jgi:hypothetical protein
MLACAAGALRATEANNAATAAPPAMPSRALALADDDFPNISSPRSLNLRVWRMLSDSHQPIVKCIKGRLVAPYEKLTPPQCANHNARWMKVSITFLQ